MKQISVCLEDRKHKRDQADGERAHHGRGVDQAALTVSDAHQDTKCHEHHVQDDSPDQAGNDPSALPGVSTIPDRISPARGQKQVSQQNAASTIHDPPPEMPLPGNVLP
jgi:hypothetical protein